MTFVSKRRGRKEGRGIILKIEGRREPKTGMRGFLGQSSAMCNVQCAMCIRGVSFLFSFLLVLIDLY